MSSIDEKLPRALNRFSWFFTIFLLGYFVHASGAWPHNIISNGVEAFRDLTVHAKSYLGMFPTRQAAFRPGTDAGVTVNKADKVEPGVTFLAGIEGEHNIMKLVDGDGNELHRWMVPFYKAIPNLDHIMPAHLRPMNESMTHIHGAHVYPDGSIVFNFDYHGLVSIDACSNIQWTKSQMTHHAVTGAQDGTVWVLSRHHHTAPVDRLPILKPPFFEDTLLQLSRDGALLGPGPRGPPDRFWRHRAPEGRGRHRGSRVRPPLRGREGRPSGLHNLAAARRDHAAARVDRRSSGVRGTHLPAHAVSSLPDVLERHLEGLPAEDDETRACA
jgi:hypothetical protein